MSNNQNDISLKDLILGIKKYIYVIKKGWLFLLLSCIISLAYFVNKTFTTKPYYLGQITYITGEGGGGGESEPEPPPLHPATSKTTAGKNLMPTLALNLHRMLKE